MADIFENDIELYIAEYCEKYNIQDMTQESQNRWNGCLAFIGKNLFRNTRILKDSNSQYNEYDIFKVCELLDMYINLCDNYSKEISIIGFSRLSCINTDTIQEWSNNNSVVYKDIDSDYILNSDLYNMCIIDGVWKLSTTRSAIYKRLMAENERSNSDLLATNPRTIGIMARLNHVHKWNLPGVSRENTSSKQLVDRQNVVQLSQRSVDILPPPVDNSEN